ncbi:hypothetical protein ABT300_04545 [Streptomyces sp. NPDC001027]|uniref:SCO2102 family sporulation regulator n=1 Tax=Streptomyces sp. NPDC001027 TaxID=3154771 RepID=UPI00332E31D8
MGWTVLYIAFGIVALWLLGEVLLQYKARLRWRLLAFVGFLGVVLGVLIPSVVVIALGAAAFAVGQTYVTLSFRRGFAEGWAFRRADAEGEGDEGGPFVKRRRGKAERHDPSLDDSGAGAAEAGFASGAPYDADAADLARDNGRRGDANAYDDDFDRDDVFTPARTAAASVYEPQPMPDDTGSYGIYSDAAYAASTGQGQQQGQQQDQYATAGQGTDQNYGYDGYSGYQQQYGYDATGEQQYAAYSDPYIGTQTYGTGSYDPAYGQQQYGQQGYGQDQYGTGGYGETPAGGVWVPQQRSTDDPLGGDYPSGQQQYPYQGDDRQQGPGQGAGYDEQYRF